MFNVDLDINWSKLLVGLNKKSFLLTVHMPMNIGLFWTKLHVTGETVPITFQLKIVSKEAKQLKMDTK